MNSFWGTATIVSVAAIVAWVIVEYVDHAFKSRRERASIEREEAYRKLAGQYAEALRKSMEEQEKIRSELVQIREHLAAVEKLLREVE